MISDSTCKIKWIPDSMQTEKKISISCERHVFTCQIQIKFVTCCVKRWPFYSLQLKHINVSKLLSLNFAQHIFHIKT